MEIIVYGTGCSKCKALEKTVQDAIDKLDVDADIVKIEELDKIMEAGILSTPGLAIDGEMKVTGRVPSSARLKNR